MVHEEHKVVPTEIQEIYLYLLLKKEEKTSTCALSLKASCSRTSVKAPDLILFRMRLSTGFLRSVEQSIRRMKRSITLWSDGCFTESTACQIQSVVSHVYVNLDFMSTYSICTYIYVLVVPFPCTFTCTVYMYLCITGTCLISDMNFIFFFIVNIIKIKVLHQTKQVPTNYRICSFKTVLSTLL